MSEELSPHTKEILIDKFGRLPELGFHSMFFYHQQNMFSLKEFNPDKKEASFEQHSIVDPSGDPFRIVEYVVLNNEEDKQIVRREKGSDINRVTYMQSDRLLDYELFYGLGATIHIVQPARNREWRGTQLVRAIYTEDKLWLLEISPAATQNRQLLSLRQEKWAMDLVEGRLTSPGTFSLPEIRLEIEGDKIMAFLENLSSYSGRLELGQVEPAREVDAREIEPYKFILSKTRDTYEIGFRDGKGWNEILTIPSTLNSQRLEAMIKGESRDWTAISNVFPVILSP